MQQDLLKYRASKQGGSTPAPEPVITSDSSTITPTSSPVVQPIPTSAISNDLAKYRAGKTVDTTPSQTASEDKTIGGFLGSLFTGATQKFGNTIGNAIAAPSNADLYAETLKQHTDVQNNLLKTIAAKKKLGQDTSRLEAALDQHTQETPKLQDFTGDVINKTAGQVIGEGVGSGLEALSGGALSGVEGLAGKELAGGAKTIASKTLTTGQKIKEGAKIGALYGAVGSGANSAAEGNGVGGVALDTGIGALTGAGLGGALGGIGTKVKDLPQDLSKEGLQNRFSNIEAKNFAKPTTIAKSGYVKPTEIFNNAKAQGTDLGQEAVKNGIRHDTLIEGGTYNTSDTADALRQDAIKASHDLIRPALAAAEPGVEKVPITEVRSKMLAQVDNIPNTKIGANEREIMRNKINQKYADNSAEARAHPDGYTLTDFHDSSILKNTEGKYKPNGTVSDNFKAQQAREEGQVYRNLLDQKSPEDLKVGEFKKELQKKFQLADYLDSLHSRKVPEGLAQKAVNLFGKVAGASAGSSLGGGLGGVVGYHFGGALFSSFERLPNPVKSAVLKTMQVEKPEAYKAIENYIGKEEANKLTRLKLPAPNTIFKGPTQENKPYTLNRLFGTTPIVETKKK